MRLYSLRVKATICLLLLVLAICLFLTLMGVDSLKSLVEKNRTDRHLAYQHQVAGLRHRAREDLTRLTQLFVLWHGDRAADADSLRGIFDRQWDYLRHTWNLASLSLYSGSGGQLVSWGRPSRRLSAAQVQEVVIGGRPLSSIHCADTCVQSLVVPVVAGDGTDLTLQVDRSLSSELSAFRETTGSDIGILSARQPREKVEGDLYLQQWHRQVLALTSQETVLPLLRRFAAGQAAMPGPRLSGSYPLDDGRSYDVQTFPVIDGDSGGARFVIVDDVTAQMDHIDASLRKLVLLSVIGTLVFIGAVMMMLWLPILRLRRLAGALPLLSDGKFEAVRNLVEPVNKYHNRLDEIEVLDYMVLSVCDQLEVMQQIVSQNTAELERMAMRDALTGLANRHCIIEELNQFLQDCAYQRGGGYLFFIDLDDFKKVNDSLGHQGGDELLRIVARRLSGVMRADSVVARLGGDEFCVFVRDLGNDGIYVALAEKMLSIVAEPIRIGESLVQVTLSIGVVAIPVHGATLEQAMDNADIAMYHAKRGGKNSYRLFSPELAEDETPPDGSTTAGRLEFAAGSETG
ncbi:diguanylate cyclase [Microbulbifer sp. TYP-18]|uniref:diguanylate cyclase domain-containing protein n=1 Tax=Microbulbifer sp. TYP-18 TaxID=3230024 RepID=UPI0034C63765